MMHTSWQSLAPLFISIVILILIAVLRAYSKTLAAVTATMPLNIMLALWIVSAAENGEQTAVLRFSGSMVVGVFATLVCVLGMWLAARAGANVFGMIAIGYLAWGVTLSLWFGAQRFWGA